MHRTLKRLLPCVLLVLAAPSRAEDFKWNKDGQATLEQFVDYVTQETGANFIYDPRVLKERVITILAPNFRKENLFSTLDSVLEMQGLGLVQTGDGQAYKILPADRLKVQPLPVYTQEDLKDLPRNDRLVTQVVTLKHVDPIQIVQVLQGLMHVPAGDVRPIPNSKVVTITEYASNMRRLLKIVETMDQENANQEVFAISLRPILTGAPPTLKVEEVLTALEAGLELRQDGTKPVLKFHPDSALLFVKGTQEQVRLASQCVQQILNSLAQERASGRKDPDPKPEKK